MIFLRVWLFGMAIWLCGMSFAMMATDTKIAYILPVYLSAIVCSILFVGTQDRR